MTLLTRSARLKAAPSCRSPVIVVAVLLAAGSLVAQAPLHRVLASGAALDDPRVTSPRHLDAPARFEPAFATRAEWEARAATLRRQIQVAVGLWPMPARGPVKAAIHGRIVKEGYTIEKVSFASLPGHYVTGNLYRPAGASGRRPAILSPHGHWDNGRLLQQPRVEIDKALASGGEKTAESARYPLQARLAHLARLGAVVFMFDMVGYADSTALTHREGFKDADAELRLHSFMGLQVWNGLRALDFLASLPDVDPVRLAITGESGGGTQTFLLSALDPRPIAAVPAVMVSGAMQGGCVCENTSLLRIDTNNIEIAALFAPKPLGLIGADDWTRDIETLGYPEIQKIYGLFGAAPNVLAKHFAFPHNYNQVSREFMYTWLNRHMKLGAAEPIAEPPFTPVSPQELAVYDAAHPRPSDEASAPVLRRTLTTRSDTALRELAKRPDEFRTVVRGALEAMVGDRFTGGFAMVEGSFKSLEGDGFAVHQAVFTRPDKRSRVPAVGLIPKTWDKRVVTIWAHPDGKAGAFEADGRTPSPAIRALFAANRAVLAPDVFLTGEAAAPAPHVKNDEVYAGFYYGYNRSVVAARAYDLLTLAGFAKSTGASEIELVGVGKAGVWALLARALAGPAIARAAIDLNAFDFDRVTRTDDEMLLPGALKYGGVMGVAAVAAGGKTTLFNAPASPVATWAPLPATVRLEKQAPTVDALIAALRP
jgi:dienelactone hydrolase